MIIDLFEFSCREKEGSGSVAVRDLKRLDVIESGDRLTWRITGTMDERERAFINLEVEGPLHVVCQRCLQPVTLAVDVAARFLVVETEPQADAVPLDEDAYDVIVGSREFDVLELVEDEVILSLPIVPKHDQCPDVTGTDAPSAPAASERISPFADLRKMTKQRKS